MPLQLFDSVIERVLIVEDDEASRNAYEYPIEECDVEPVQEAGPLENLDVFVERTIANGTQGAISDFQLKVSGYANFDGAELIGRWYERGYPALLCTKYETARQEEIRRYRRQIPVLINAGDLDPDAIAKGFEKCIRELRGDIDPSRKPWRTLVRIDDLEEDQPHRRVFLIVPSWDPFEAVSLYASDLPESITTTMQPGYRCHAQVNIGAESESDLFFYDWEPGS